VFKRLSFTTRYEHCEMQKPLHKYIRLHYTDLKGLEGEEHALLLRCTKKHIKHSRAYLQRKHRESHRFYFTTVERSALTRVMNDPHLFVCLVVTLVASLSPPLSPSLILNLYIRLSLQSAHSLLSRDILLALGLDCRYTKLLILSKGGKMYGSAQNNRAGIPSRGMQCESHSTLA
jgi:hypothetical protein